MIISPTAALTTSSIFEIRIDIMNTIPVIHFDAAFQKEHVMLIITLTMEHLVNEN